MTKEYRIVATEKHGVFRCYGTNLSGAKSDLGKTANDTIFQGAPAMDGHPGVMPSRGRLQWRDSAIQGNDSTWTDFTPEQHAGFYQDNIQAALARV